MYVKDTLFMWQNLHHGQSSIFVATLLAVIIALFCRNPISNIWREVYTPISVMIVLPLKMTHYITPKEGQSLPRRGLYLNRWNLNFRLDKSYTFCESPFFRDPTPFNARTTPLRTLLSTAQPPERRTNLGGQFRRTFIRSFLVVLLFIRSFCFFATLSQMTLAL